MAAGGVDSLFEQRFDLPAEAIGAGRIVQFVERQAGQTIPTACPGYSQEPGERCTATLRWAGSLTFTKLPDDPTMLPPLVIPRVPDRIDATRPVPTPPADTGDDLIAPLVPAKAKADAAWRTVSFTADCASGCTGTATLTAAGGRRIRTAAATFGRIRFTVKAGGSRTVRLTLPAAARRHLRRGGRVRLALALKPKSGPTRRVTLTVALPKR